MSEQVSTSRTRRSALIVGVVLAVVILIGGGVWWGITQAHARALAQAQDTYASAVAGLADAQAPLGPQVSEAQALLEVASTHDLADNPHVAPLTDAVSKAHDAQAQAPTAPTGPDDVDALAQATTSTQASASSVTHALDTLTRASDLLAADELASADKAATTARTALSDALGKADGVQREGVDDATLKTLDDAIATARGIVVPGDQGWTEPTTTTDTQSGAQSGTPSTAQSGAQSGVQSGGGDIAPTAALVTTHFDAAATGQTAADALNHAIDATTTAHQAWADQKAAQEAAAAAAAAAQAQAQSTYTGGTSNNYYGGSTPNYTGGGNGGYTGGGSSSGSGSSGSGGFTFDDVPTPATDGPGTGVCYSEGC